MSAHVDGVGAEDGEEGHVHVVEEAQVETVTEQIVQRLGHDDVRGTVVTVIGRDP